MKKKKLSLMIMVFSLAGCGGASDADQTPSASGGTAMMLNAGGAVEAAVDSRQFLMDAYGDGLSEIQLSQLALQKGANSEVRNFAQRMIDDHARINDRIKQLAQSKNIALPTDLSPEQKTLADRLASMSGEEFERAYMGANVDAHEKDVAAAATQARQGSDSDVKALASGRLPILEVHLAAAEEMNSLLDPAAFLEGAYRDGLAEIQRSQLALQRAQDDNVKQFAQRMVDDHNEANQRIATLAQQMDISMPDALSSAQQAVADELARFSGADFDKAFMDRNVIAHVKDVRRANQQAQQGRNVDVMNLAQQTLPVLASHLASAIDIDRTIEPGVLYRAYQDGTAEIALAQLALMRSLNEQVKSFARQMLTDHADANAHVASLARQRGLAVPVELSPGQLRTVIDLMSKSGSQFDREYMDINVQVHQQAVALAREQARDGDIGSFAQQAVDVLKQHLMQAMRILQQLVSPEP